MLSSLPPGTAVPITAPPPPAMPLFKAHIHLYFPLTDSSKPQAWIFITTQSKCLESP